MADHPEDAEAAVEMARRTFRAMYRLGYPIVLNQTVSRARDRSLDELKVAELPQIRLWCC